MPTVQAPPFGFTKDNTTVTFIEMLGNLGSGIVVIPLISLMEDIAVCKAFGKHLKKLQDTVSRRRIKNFYSKDRLLSFRCARIAWGEGASCMFRTVIYGIYRISNS